MIRLDFGPSLPHSTLPDFAEPSLNSFFAPNTEQPVPIFERERAKALLREIGLLGPNWDGYGAVPFSKAGANAHRFFEILENQTPGLINPDISPTSGGTVAMEWGSVQGEAYIEIGNTKYSCFIRSRSGQSQFYEGDAESIEGDLLAIVQRSLFPIPSPILTINSISIAA